MTQHHQIARAPNWAIARAAACAVVATLRRAGHRAYFAGGCVRDELLGLDPTDYDVATDAPPARVTGLFARTAEVGAAFGVVLVREREALIEVATFRADGPYSDRRRPDSVTFSDPEQDAQRRDFTVNALFLDPAGGGEGGGGAGKGVPEDGSVWGRPEVTASVRGGRVLDYVGGRVDLDARVLRAVGTAEARLAEDHLRALRAVRFAARLGFEIEAATAAAITRQARELAGVSRERIGDEVRKMLMHPRRARAIGLLRQLGLEGPALEGSTREGTAGQAAEVLGRLGGEHDLGTYLAAWALDHLGRDFGRYGPPDELAVQRLVRAWRRALNLANDERDALGETLRALAAVRKEWGAAGVAQRKRWAAGTRFPGAQALLAVLEPEQAAVVEADVGELRRTESGIGPEPLLSGDDLVAAGWRPGPRFKRVLDAVYDAQLEGRVRTRAEAAAWAEGMGRG